MNIVMKLKMLLHKIFWIDKFEEKSKLFTFVGKFFMYGYIVTILLSLIAFISSFDLSNLMVLLISILFFSIMYCPWDYNDTFIKFK
ncbi:hypothetical protein [Clostridium sp. BSD9I1]|uniref:hypothetical protein n=1 Tax=Clostridium sp. BSD9I1 TaxID=2003589 RepID=UPI001FA92ECD|nr:hypothetical protein [Clostridium sp. BSD9I1]